MPLLHERHQRAGRWDVVGGLLAEQGNKLKAAGADFFLLACNTVHISADRIERAVDLPFLHIVGPTARKVQQGGVTTVRLLGSRYMMTGGYFVGRLRERYGLNVLVAEGEHQDNLHDALYGSLSRAYFCPPHARNLRLRSRIWSSAAHRPSSWDAPSWACSSMPGTAPLIDTTLATPRLRSTDKPADGYALVNLADDIEAFMDAVGLQSAVLLGPSSGGYVAQQVAGQVPRRVGLVLVGAPRSLQGWPAFADEVDRLTDPVDPTWVEESVTWFPRYHDVPDWYIKDRLRDGLRVLAHVWMAGLAGLTTAVPPSESGTITAPTLIIWGERDELLPPQDGYLLAAAIPGSRLIAYEDTGHLVLWEQPERVATDLADFVAGLSTSGQNSTPIS
jgi:pimeloyl-ACP methyl ester carboxylesterase